MSRNLGATAVSSTDKRDGAEMARSKAGAILLRNTNRPFLSFAVKGVAAKRSLRLQIAAASMRKNLRA